MTHEIKVQPLYYDKIKSGEKIYEVRLLDEKRKAFKIGDHLKIYKEPALNEFVLAKITDLVVFPSFEAMATTLPLSQVGRPTNT